MRELLQNKKALIIIGIVLLLVIGFILFLVFGNKDTKVVKTADVEVTLTWWKPKAASIYKDTLGNFKKLPGNQKVKINIVDVDFNDEYYRNLITDFARGRGPDLFSYNNTDFPALKEFMTPISNIPGITESKLLADYKTNFADVVVRSGVDLDKVYGVTSYIDTLQLYYNKNLLQQAGISQPPATWEDLDKQLSLLSNRNLEQKFNQSAISLGTGYLSKDGENSNYNIAKFQDILPVLIAQNGGQMYDYTTDKVSFGANRNQKDLDTSNITSKDFDVKFDQDNPTYKAIRFYLDFAESRNSRYSWNTESKLNTDAFMEGKLAYILNYSTFKDDIAQRNSRLSYGISELPQLDLKNKRTYGTFMMDGINRQLEIEADLSPKDTVKVAKLQKAREFLYYLTNKTTQADFFAKTNLPAARKDIINEQISGDEKLRIFATGNLYAFTYYQADTKRIASMWGNLIFRVQYQNFTLDASLKQAISEYALTVQKGPRIPL